MPAHQLNHACLTAVCSFHCEFGAPITIATAAAAAAAVGDSAAKLAEAGADAEADAVGARTDTPALEPTTGSAQAAQSSATAVGSQLTTTLNDSKEQNANAHQSALIAALSGLLLTSPAPQHEKQSSISLQPFVSRAFSVDDIANPQLAEPTETYARSSSAPSPLAPQGDQGGQALLPRHGSWAYDHNLLKYLPDMQPSLRTKIEQVQRMYRQRQQYAHGYDDGRDVGHEGEEYSEVEVEDDDDESYFRYDGDESFDSIGPDDEGEDGYRGHDDDDDPEEEEEGAMKIRQLLAITEELTRELDREERRRDAIELQLLRRQRADNYQVVVTAPVASAASSLSPPTGPGGGLPPAAAAEEEEAVVVVSAFGDAVQATSSEFDHMDLAAVVALRDQKTRELQGGWASYGDSDYHTMLPKCLV